MLCGQEALGGRADSPPPAESWRKAIGLQSPSSGTEVIYGSPEEVWEEEGEEEQEWYDESPEPEPLSPATKKRIERDLEEFKRDVDECTTGSDWESGPEGKTLSEIDEKIAKWDREMKESRMQAMHRRRVEGNSVQHVLATCIYLRMPFHRGGGNGGAATRQGRQGISAYQVTAGHGGAAARQGISACQVSGTGT